MADREEIAAVFRTLAEAAIAQARRDDERERLAVDQARRDDERARLETQRSERELEQARILAQKERYEREPWRRRVDDLLRGRPRDRVLSVQELRKQAVQAFLAGELSITEALTLGYGCWGSAADLHWWVSITVVETSEAARVEIHNAHVVGGLEELSASKWGPHLQKLRFPIFPDAWAESPDIARYNASLLRWCETGDAPSGAGPTPALVLFRAPREEKRKPAVSHGGESSLELRTGRRMPTLTDATNAALIEQAVRHIRAKIDARFQRLERLWRQTPENTPENAPSGGVGSFTTLRTARTSTRKVHATAPGPVEPTPRHRLRKLCSTSYAVPAAHIELKGGDYADCLSSDDLDRLLVPVFKRGNLLRAIELYHVRVGQTAPDVAHSKIRILLQQHDQVVAPLHIRHHWTTAIFRSEGARIGATVLDSAPSEVTAEDIHHLCHLIGADASIISTGRQPRGSNECGVHAIVNAWRAHLRLPAKIVEDSEYLDLSHLRPYFARWADQPRLTEALFESVAKDPRAAIIGGSVQFPVAASGLAKPHATHTAVQDRRPPPYEYAHAFSPRPFAPSITAVPFVPSSMRLPEGGTPNEARTSDRTFSNAARRPQANEPTTDSNVNRRNLCYLHAATQALDLAMWGHRVTRSTNSLWRLQARLGHEHGAQQDVVETIPQLIANCVTWKGACAFWCREDGQFSRCDDPQRFCVPHATRPFIALDNQGDAFLCPTSHEVVAWIEFSGPVRHSVSGISTAEQGHYSLHMGCPPRNSCSFITCYVLHPVQRLDDAAPALAAPRNVPPRSTTCPTNQVRQCAPLDSRAQATAARALGISTDAATRIVELGSRVQRARHEARQASSAQQSKVREPPAKTTARAAQPVPRRQLRAILDTLAGNDYIRVHWARQCEADGHHEAGVWYGRVRATTPSVLVDFTHSQCPDCLAPRSLGSQILVEIPLKNTLYYEVSKAGLPSVAGCVCLATDPTDERPYEHGTGTANAQRVLSAVEGRCLAAPGAVNPRATRTGATGQSWHIFAGRPPHVHELVWRKLASCTRTQHLRWLHCIRGMHADLLHRPLPAAIVEYVLRMATARRWCWATVSSALSACASALAQLPIYTSEQHSIDLRADPYFAQALQNAQRMARTTAGKASLSTGMTVQQLEDLTGSHGIKAPNPRLLLLLGWHFGARIGDLRQVRPCDVIVRHSETRPDGAVPTAITFRFGKGAAFWGPYSVHAVLPQRVASDLIAAVHACPTDEPLFTLHDQATLSHAVGSLAEGTGRLNLRSVRRGAIQNAAERGLSDEDVMRLSGHKRLDTLYRYLGWGIGSHSAKNAAIRRYQAAMPRGAGSHQLVPSGAQPPKMGRHSGFTGLRGRRVEAPPLFFPKKPPTREQCGVAPSPDHDVTQYPLHIKETSRVNWQALKGMAEPTPLRHAVAKAEVWCTSDQWYGPAFSVEPSKIPGAGFTGDQIRELLRADKIRPHHGPVSGFVKAFTVAQHAKRRLRVIAEPAMNQTFERDQMYPLAYPSRLERRARARGAKFSVEFDFAAFFDQFELAKNVMPWFVLRSRDVVEGHRLFALTRMPMGASFAPGVAQAVTSSLVYPLTTLQGVRVDTMIDNVRIVADSKEAFIRAVRVFLQRVRAASITLNDAAEWEGLTDDALASRCAVTEAPRIFLGEKYSSDTVCNTDAAVEKLTAALHRYSTRNDMEDPEAPLYTCRHFASFVGLMLFMAHTLDVPLTKLHTLLRAYGAIVSGTNEWDSTCVISSEAVDRQVRALSALLIRNVPVPLPILRPPELDLHAYDAAIEVDASLTAWGAVVRFTRTGRTVTLQQRWSTPVSHSAHAEPKAARRAIQWVRAQPGCANARIAIVTDHVAMATGQRRWYASYGGFSTSFFLNSFFDQLYHHGGGEVFHIDGARNRADQLSRDPRAPLTLAVREVDVAFTDLRSVRHPHLVIPRFPYQL